MRCSVEGTSRNDIDLHRIGNEVPPGSQVSGSVAEGKNKTRKKAVHDNAAMGKLGRMMPFKNGTTPVFMTNTSRKCTGYTILNHSCII